MIWVIRNGYCTIKKLMFLFPPHLYTDWVVQSVLVWAWEAEAMTQWERNCICISAHGGKKKEKVGKIKIP